jgi:hypothetical protein
VEKLKTVAQLQPNQALADIRIKTTTKVWVFGIVITRKLTATASVVEFVDAETNSFNNSATSGVQNASSHLSHDVTTNNDNVQENPVDKTKPEITFTPNVDQNDIRQSISNRVQEILTILKTRPVEDVESLAKELSDIENWYNDNGFNTWDENKSFKTAKKLVLSK